MGSLFYSSDDLIGYLVGAERQQQEVLVSVGVPFVSDIAVILTVTTWMTMSWQNCEPGQMRQCV